MEDLSELNARLLQSRKRYGLGEDGSGAIVLRQPPVPGVRVSGETATPTLGEALGSLPKEGRYRCSGTLGNGDRCPVAVAYPGRCPKCYAAVERQERAEKIRARMNRIPGEFREVTWEALEREGQLVSRAGGARVHCDLARVARVREALRGLPVGGRAVIVGPAGRGKSTLASAWLRSEIERGVSNAWWVAADDIDSETVVDVGEHGEGTTLPRDLVSRGESIVLDDLGGEIAGAPLGSGVLAQRIQASSKAIARRAARNAGRLVITTPFGEKDLALFYGGRIVRRVFEGALVIDLGDG